MRLPPSPTGPGAGFARPLPGSPSIGHGPQYLTVVLDLTTGAVVFVGEGKGIDALEPFWKQLKGFRAKLRAVAIDMSPAYIRALEILKKREQHLGRLAGKYLPESHKLGAF